MEHHWLNYYIKIHAHTYSTNVLCLFNFITFLKPYPLLSWQQQFLFSIVFFWERKGQLWEWVMHKHLLIILLCSLRFYWCLQREYCYCYLRTARRQTTVFLNIDHQIISTSAVIYKTENTIYKIFESVY